MPNCSRDLVHHEVVQRRDLHPGIRVRVAVKVDKMAQSIPSQFEKFVLDKGWQARAERHFESLVLHEGEDEGHDGHAGDDEGQDEVRVRMRVRGRGGERR